MTKTARRYAGLSADERDAQRRARLIAAAHEVIGTNGYASTRIEQICSVAGVSTRHFYQQYSNKEDAFSDLYESLTTASFTAAAASLEVTAGRPMIERVSAAFLAYLSPMVVDLRTARIAFVEIMGVSPQFEERRLGFRESLASLVESEGKAAVARGEISDRDFRFAALALAGAASSVVYDWAVRADRADVRDLEAALADLAVTLIIA